MHVPAIYRPYVRFRRTIDTIEPLLSCQTRRRGAEIQTQICETMPTLTISEYDMAREFANEFARDHLRDHITGLHCVYRSHGFPGSRFVMKVETPSQNYALKIDTISPESGRLPNEFQVLTRVHDHFRRHETARVVRPVFLSPGGAFMVTEYIDRPTAVDVIYNSTDDKQVAQIYRRAGSWLHHLHSIQKPTNYAFRPRWMTENIRELSTLVPPDIARVSQPMVEIFLAEAARLRNRPDLRVFSHGDFHGLNLIMGQGTTIGLDFTEARDKLAVYDIVDFLKADIFRDSTNSEVDRSGVLKSNKQMFFKLYRHPIDMEILDCCLRGRLLKDWLRLWRPDFICSQFEERKRDRLETRLRQIFL